MREMLCSRRGGASSVHRAACGTGLALGFVRFLSGEGRAEGRGRAGTEGMCESGVGAGNDGGVDGPGGG